MRHDFGTRAPRDGGGILSQFSPNERDFLAGLKRRDVESLTDCLSAKRARGETTMTTPPLRIGVLKSNLPDDAKRDIFATLRDNGSEKYVSWVVRLLCLPLGRLSPPPKRSLSMSEQVAGAQKLLDSVIIGHSGAKKEILKLVCQDVMKPEASRSYALGFEGPPGVGKTRLVHDAVGPALCKPVITVSLGGATDSAFLLGQLYTYEGSKEGRLAAGLIEAGVMDPIFHFDELDKVSSTDRGQEITNTLIHLIDPTCNMALRDRYFHGVDIDFSRCTFLFTYNDASRVNPVLLDRIKRIRMDKPTSQECEDIVRAHVVPRLCQRYGVKYELGTDTVRELVRLQSDGMRGVERSVEDVFGEALLASATETTPIQADGTIDAHFASRVLAARSTDDAAHRRCAAPPPFMYT